jgi:hypothetical protein
MIAAAFIVGGFILMASSRDHDGANAGFLVITLALIFHFLF